MINKEQLAKDCLIMAQDIAPKDTGNLAFNAIKLSMLQNGFEVSYDEAVAPYIDKLEYGYASTKGFIGRTRGAIVAYVYGKGEYATNINDTRERVTAQAVDNPARLARFLDSLEVSSRDLMEE